MPYYRLRPYLSVDTGMTRDLPKTDLSALSRDVQDAEAALPCNLSDFWLELISRDLDHMGDDDSEEEPPHTISGPMYLILKILLHKAGTNQMELSDEELYQYFVDYQLEVGLEMVSRRTDVKAEPATLATIFTDRDVMVHQTGLHQA